MGESEEEIADLRRSRFHELHQFILAHNEGPVLDLTGVQVFDDCDLTQSSPLVRACLAGAHFGERVSFDGVRFGEDTCFAGAEFDSGCSFRNGGFGVRSNFDRAVLHEPVFYNATFNDEARFQRATIVQADFAAAGFGDWCDFDDANFRIYVGFRDARFGAVQFKRTKFLGLADFTNATFSSSADFRDAYFQDAPHFHGCSFHADTVFPSEAGFADTRSDSAAAAYRVIKKAMEELRAHEEQALFHVLEQRSRRSQLVWYDPARLISAIYDLAAKYGQSFTRPMAWIGALFVGLCWLLLLRVELVGNALLPSRSDLAEVLLIAIRQTFRPFEILSRYPPPTERYSLWLQLLCVAYSLAVLGLFALFLVALRRRFKLD